MIYIYSGRGREGGRKYSERKGREWRRKEANDQNNERGRKGGRGNNERGRKGRWEGEETMNG